jgi:hypothetical protein
LCLWEIYIFPGSVHIFSCSKIDRLILEIYKSLTDIWVKELFFGNKEAAQFHLGIQKWELDIYIGFSSALHLQCMCHILIYSFHVHKEDSHDISVLLFSHWDHSYFVVVETYLRLQSPRLRKILGKLGCLWTLKTGPIHWNKKLVALARCRLLTIE